MEKLCWFCKHFRYSNADAGYSEYTPGSSFEIGCCMNRWDFDSYLSTQAHFAVCISTAATCPDFVLAEDIVKAAGNLTGRPRI